MDSFFAKIALLKGEYGVVKDAEFIFGIYSFKYNNIFYSYLSYP